MGSFPYQAICDRCLTTRYDSRFEELIEQRHLSWLPWVGSSFDEIRLLVIAESHYISVSSDDTSSDTPDVCQKILADTSHTRKIVSQYPISGRVISGWVKCNPTFDNLNRVLVGEALNTDIGNNPEKRERLWSQLAYMNIVQRPMRFCGKQQERPTAEDFAQGWGVVLAVAEILQPHAILCTSLEAARSYDGAMKNLGFDVTKQQAPRIGRYYAYTADLPMVRCPLYFTRHPGAFFFVAQVAQMVAKSSSLCMGAFVTRYNNHGLRRIESIVIIS